VPSILSPERQELGDAAADHAYGGRQVHRGYRQDDTPDAGAPRGQGPRLQSCADDVRQQDPDEARRGRPVGGSQPRAQFFFMMLDPATITSARRREQERPGREGRGGQDLLRRAEDQRGVHEGAQQAGLSGRKRGKKSWPSAPELVEEKSRGSRRERLAAGGRRGSRRLVGRGSLPLSPLRAIAAASPDRPPAHDVFTGLPRRRRALAFRPRLRVVHVPQRRGALRRSSGCQVVRDVAIWFRRLRRG